MKAYKKPNLNNKGYNPYNRIARKWFINNHPLVQQWERDGVIWHMHHWDKDLKKTNPQRYHMWMIEDLVPMTRSAHTAIHSTGKHHTEETRRKLSESHKRENLTEETKQKMRKSHIGEKNPMYGKKHTDEWKKNASERERGDKHWNYGKHMTDEEKRKIWETLKGHKMSEETRRKLSESNRKRLGRKVICVETEQIFDTITDASRWCNTPHSNISACLIGKQKTAGGYHWEYYDKEINENE